MRKQLGIFIGTFLFLILATTGVVLYGKGYRLNINTGKVGVSETGLLVVKSTPDGAQIFIDGHLTTATDNTISLAPKDYDIRIVKQGYFPWEKTIKIQKEVVSKIDALLFTTTPKLESITDSGVNNPTMDPSRTQIAFTVSSQSIRENGIYVLDMTSRPILTLQSSSTQIADDTENSFSQSSLTWSPDGKQLVATISGQLGASTYLLDATSFNSNPTDVTETLASVNDNWEKMKADKATATVDALKANLKKVISEDFQILSWSPDETKILYTASQSATIPPIITPPLIGTDPTTEARTLKKGSVYVYDTEEDKNFKIADAVPVPKTSLMWFPDSNHLISVNNRKITIMEYDGANKTIVYAGPFVDSYVFPWSDGSKLLILTDLDNSNASPNLYTISLN